MGVKHLHHLVVDLFLAAIVFEVTAHHHHAVVGWGQRLSIEFLGHVEESLSHVEEGNEGIKDAVSERHSKSIDIVLLVLEEVVLSHVGFNGVVFESSNHEGSV